MVYTTHGRGDILKSIPCVSVRHDKSNFLLVSLSQLLHYTFQTTWYGMAKIYWARHQTI